ncbi:26S proteasome non-ATPase regulatory subunit 10 [Toxocara canis]|uniref:26S proteasome non-ATPase regulatory subunit 10 n=1 Tax=Toxocara canis TaxID=6265 RepID=A0A0B2W3T5_TOXCA|nr:26S proteasome non-ATPase regulatory subunit 10 [Toxocara canis]
MSNSDETTPEVKAELVQLLRENKAEEAKRLLQKYANLAFAKDDSGRTAIHWAASGGCLEIVQFCVCLRDEDAISVDDMGWSPLMIASSAGRLDVVRYLATLPHVDVNMANSNGQTALHYAASKNHPMIASILLESGADVNAQDRYRATPLHRAASQGHQKIVSLLLAAPKLRIDITDSSGCSPLHLAIEERRQDVAIALVEKGANLYLENKIVSLLLAAPKLRIDITDSSGCSPLHLAIEERRQDVAIALVEKGANLYLENKEKRQPIDLVDSSEFLNKLKAAAKRYEAA